MFLARIVFFRLHESPRYLVNAGRHQEAIQALQMISKFNGSELSLDVEDVRDHLRPSEIIASNNVSRQSPQGDIVFDADDEESSPKDVPRPPLLVPKGSRQVLRDSPESDPPGYSSTGEPNVSLSSHGYQTPEVTSPTSPILAPDDPYLKYSRRDSSSSFDTSRSPVRPRHPRERSSSSLAEVRSKLYWKLPLVISRPLWAWLDRVTLVLSPEWMRTTILVWIVWFAMSLGASRPASKRR